MKRDADFAGGLEANSRAMTLFKPTPSDPYVIESSKSEAAKCTEINIEMEITKVQDRCSPLKLKARET